MITPQENKVSEMHAPGLTMVQKILARASGREHVQPGEYITCVPDHVVTQEMQWPTHKRNLERIQAQGFRHPEKAIIVIDHTPSAATGSLHAQTHHMLKQFTRDMGVENFFGPNTGLRHLVLTERGFARPGMLIFSDEGNIASIGALGALNIPMSTDVLAPLVNGEHWVHVPKTARINLIGELPTGVTARDLIQVIIRDHEKAGTFLQCCIEYGGPGVGTLSIDERQALLASSFHTGADTAIMELDELALAYVAERDEGRPWSPIKSDPDAHYDVELTYDLSTLEPMVTEPPTQDGAVPVHLLAGQHIDYAAIGSCANNRLDDLRAAATVLRGKKIAPHVTFYVSPGSQNVYAAAAREGLLEVLVEAGATILSPGCNTCWGYLGVISGNDVAITTHQFNYQGRNGSVDARIHLASPYTVAASALAGAITDPRTVLAALATE